MYPPSTRRKPINMVASIAQRLPTGRSVRIKERSRTGGKMPAHDVVVYTAPG
jgi:hypothetical protein